MNAKQAGKKPQTRWGKAKARKVPKKGKKPKKQEKDWAEDFPHVKMLKLAERKLLDEFLRTLGRFVDRAFADEIRKNVDYEKLLPGEWVKDVEDMDFTDGEDITGEQLQMRAETVACHIAQLERSQMQHNMLKKLGVFLKK